MTPDAAECHLVGTHNRRDGVLVIRAWLEEGSPEAFRARVISVAGTERGEETVTWVASADEVHEAVDSWIEGLSTPD